MAYGDANKAATDYYVQQAAQGIPVGPYQPLGDVSLGPPISRAKQPRAKKPGRGAKKPLTFEQMAQQQTQAQLKPLLDFYAAQQAAAQQRAIQRQQAIQGFTQAVAEMSKSVAPNIAGIYSTATHDQGLLGQGFANEFKGTENQSAQNVNDFLAKQGAPAAQSLPGDTGAAGVVNYLGGVIPGNSLAQQGAGFASAASFLPASTMGRGENYLLKALSDAEAQQQSIATEAAKVQEQGPDIYNQILAGLQKNALDSQKLTWAQKQWAATYGQKNASLKSLDTYRQQTIQLRKQGLITDAQYKSRMASIAQQRANQAGARGARASRPRVSATLSAGNHYLTDVYGNPILKKGKKVPYTPPASSTSSNYYTIPATKPKRKPKKR